VAAVVIYDVCAFGNKMHSRRFAAAVPEVIVSRRLECLEWRLAYSAPGVLAVTWYGRSRQVNGQVDYIRADGDQRIVA
jgi:hypothetical protein